MNALRIVSLALVFLAAAALPVLGPPTATADDPAETQLLVKCKKSEVANVLAALARQRVRVYDLATMAELHGPGKTGGLPVLPDAVEALTAFHDALGAIRKDATRLRLTEFSVSSKRLAATLHIDGPDAVERLPATVAAAPYFRARAARPELGALARTSAGWTAKVYVHFGSAGASEAPPKGLGRVPLALVMEKAREAGMNPVNAGAERVSRDRRGGGHSIASREITFAAGTLEGLLKFLGGIQSVPGLTVTEVRWKLDLAKGRDPTSDKITRPIVRVATRALPR